MRHTITIGEKNTWTDWHLIPYCQPLFLPPSVKTKYIDIPGGDGAIDLTSAITGYPTYANREGSWQFIYVGSDADWISLYSEIAAYLHGQKRRVILEDEPGWYYEGRFSVANRYHDEKHATITINYNVDPYAWSQIATDEPWLWDPFSFVDGVIGNGYYAHHDYLERADVVTATYAPLTFTVGETGHATLLPTFSVPVDEGTTANSVNIIWESSGATRMETIQVGGSDTIQNLTMKGGVWNINGAPCTVTVATDTGTATLVTNFTAVYQNADAFGHIEITTTPRTLDFSSAFPDAGAWPLDAAGDAPVTPEFAATGANVTLTATHDGATASTYTIFAGTPRTWPNLVLYQGGWLYTGRPAELTAATEDDTATLAVNFRRGKL